jgi:NAD(P)H-hydrate epimerase
MRILTSAQMREADRRTIDDIGIASLVLMENAGRQVVGAIESAFEQLPTMRVAILCGPHDGAARDRCRGLSRRRGRTRRR